MSHLTCVFVALAAKVARVLGGGMACPCRDKESLHARRRSSLLAAAVVRSPTAQG